MKKIITLITIAFMGMVSSNAQITINQADFANVWFHAIQANDTLVDTAHIHIGNPGTNMVWAFDSLHNNLTDSLQFMDISATPYASNFATANMAFKQASSPGTFNFVNSSPSAAMILGQGLNQGNISTTTPNEAVPVNPPMTFMNFPSTYNATFNGASHGTIILDSTFTYSFYTIDTTRIEHHITYTSLIDAWGSVTSPSGTYPALRQKYTEYTLDSIFVHNVNPSLWIFSTITIKDSSLRYRWFANSQSFPIVEVTMDTTWSIPHTAVWLKSSNTGTNDLTISNTAFQIFPNPAKDELNIINADKNASIITVYDAMGRLMDTQRLTGMTTKINTSSYANGLYSYRILGNDNTSLKTGKFAIVK